MTGFKMRCRKPLKAWLTFLVLATIFSCSQRPDAQTENRKTDAKDSILYRKEIVHSFSSPNDRDSFKIYVTGPSIVEGQVTFQIKTSEGQMILNEKYSSNYFLDYDFDRTLGTEEDYIKKRIDSFFDEKHFKQPAITADEPFDENYSKKEIWEDIKSDKSSIGFSYLIGKEDGRHIAYSKKLGKVVMYFNCC